jgi:hypothetical protein
MPIKYSDLLVSSKITLGIVKFCSWRKMSLVAFFILITQKKQTITSNRSILPTKLFYFIVWHVNMFSISETGASLKFLFFYNFIEDATNEYKKKFFLSKIFWSGQQYEQIMNVLLL